MKLKQKVKNIAGILGLLTMIGAPAMTTIAAYADTSCAGVQTSVISCNQTGSCPNTTPTEGTDPGNDPIKISKYLQDYGHPYGVAYNPTEGTNPNGDAKAITAYKKAYGHDYGVCKDGTNPVTDPTQNGVWALLLVAINILTAGVGIAAVGGIVYGSILYTTAGGNADQTKKAIEFIRNVIIGLIAYGLMFAVLNFIIPGGLFAS